MSNGTLETREGLLARLLEAGKADVEQLTCTKERASVVMTDEAVERNAALFASKPEVGLQEFMDAQDALGGKFAAFVSTVGFPRLISLAAVQQLPGGYEELSYAVSMGALKSMLGGENDGCTWTVGDVCATLGIIGGDNTKEQDRAAADEFFAGCLRQATEWALSTQDNPAIPGDTTPGVVH